MLISFIVITLFIVLTLLLLDSLLGYRYENVFPCIGIFGKPGSGKTLLLTKLCYLHVKKGWDVYADFPCYVDKVQQFSDEDFKTGKWLPDGRGKNGKLKKKILLVIDEIGTLYNNRDFKNNFTPSTLKWWKEHRHKGVKIIYASQAYNDMDKKLRVLTDFYYLLKKPFLKLIRYAKLVQVSTEISNDNKETGGQIIDLYKYSPFTQWKFIYLPKWVKKFNSFA